MGIHKSDFRYSADQEEDCPGMSASWDAAPLPVENIHRLAINLYSELLTRWALGALNTSFPPFSILQSKSKTTLDIDDGW
jgi:hypothetical protein